MAKKKRQRKSREVAPDGAGATETLPAEMAELPLREGTVLHAFSGLYEVDVREGIDDRGAQPIRRVANALEEVSNRDEEQFVELGPTDIEVYDTDTLLCAVSGKLKKGPRLLAQPVVVGDRVRVRAVEAFGPDSRGRRLREGYIEEVLPRRSALGRSRYNKAGQLVVANLDQVVIVMALREPEVNTHRLDRFLVLAEASDLRPVICFNKADLVPKRSLSKVTKPLLDLYRGIGYNCVVVSAETDFGIEELRHELQGHISAVIGSSGVGKSSLVNAIQPGLHLWVGDVMDIGKGRHTTTDVSLHRLDGGGYLADTPGIKTVSLLESQEVNMDVCFPDLAPYITECRFNNCTHRQEPGCAVREAAELGKIAASRYDSYKRMFEEEQESQRVAEKSQPREGRSRKATQQLLV